MDILRRSLGGRPTASSGFPRLWLAGETLEARAMLSAAPVAVDDAYHVAKNLPLVASAANGVLANDSDSAELTLTASVVAEPTHGILTLAGDGSFTYTPTAGYVGADSFTYSDSDGVNTSNVATVRLTVAPTPGTVVNQTYSVFENQTLSVSTPGLLTGSFDSNGPPLATQLVSQAGHGVVTMNTDGSFSYQPAANYVGNDSFTYKGNDGILDSNVAQVTITVQAVTQAPTAVDSQWHVEENGQLVVGDSPRTSEVTATDAFNDLVYDPASGYLYGDTNTGLVSINPTTGALGTPAPISGTPGKMVISDNGEYIYLLTSNAGTVDRFDTFTNTVDLTFSMDSGVSICSLSAIPGTPDSVLITEYVQAYDSTLGTYVFKNGVALPDHVGNDSLGSGGPNQTFVDPGGVDAYGYDSIYSSFDFTFMAIDSNGVHTISGSGDPLYGNVGWLSEASGIVFDGEGQGVSLTTDQLVGSFAGGPNYTLDAPNDKLYSVSSNNSTATIYSYSLSTLTPINTLNVPVSGDVGSVTRFGSNGLAFLDSAGQAVMVTSDLIANNPYRGVLADASDPNNLPLTAQVVTAPKDGALTLNADGTFSYYPNPGFYGVDSFTYVANNGTLSSSAATVTIDVDAPPIANSQNYRVAENTPTTIPANLGVLANDTDPNGYSFTAKLVQGPTSGTLVLNSDGSFIYTPKSNYTGADSFTYEAVDAYGSSLPATINLTISALPVAAKDAYTYAQGGLIVSAANGVLVNDTPVDDEAFTAQLVTTTSNGALVLNSDGSFTYQPNAGFSGTDSFTYRANDGGLNSTVATVTLTAGVLAPPLAKDDSVSVDELQPTTIDVLLNDVASIGAVIDPTTVEITSGPAHGVATVDPTTGVITYTSADAYLGADSLTYVVKDNLGSVSNPATVSITVARTSTDQNPSNPFDVNDDGSVNPLDAATEINYLKYDGSEALPSGHTAGSPFYDVIGNMQCVPLDVLFIINDLQQSAASPDATETSVATAGAQADASANVGPVAPTLADAPATSAVATEPAEAASVSGTAPTAAPMGIVQSLAATTSSASPTPTLPLAAVVVVPGPAPGESTALPAALIATSAAAQYSTSPASAPGLARQAQASASVFAACESAAPAKLDNSSASGDRQDDSMFAQFARPAKSALSRLIR
jgi:hypothetical protein